MRLRVPVFVALAASSTLIPSGGAASDFWDDVKNPGIAAFREALERAEAAYGARRFPAAEALAREAVAKRADRADGHLVLALALGALGRDVEALPHLLRVHTLDASAFDDGVRGTEAARIAIRAEEWTLAADVLHRVVRSMRAGPTRRFLLADEGDVLLSLGPSVLAECVRAYESALRDGHGVEPPAALGLALALHRSGRAPEAAAFVLQAVDSGRVESVLSAVAAPAAERKARLALVHEASGRVADAVSAWREVANRPTWADHARAQIARLERGSTAR